MAGLAIWTYVGGSWYEVGIKYPSLVGCGAVISRLLSGTSFSGASIGAGVEGGRRENERSGIFSW